MKDKYIVYFCLIDNRYKYEQNRGWSIQNEKPQYTKKEAVQKCKELNKETKNVYEFYIS